jgi:hypothetical protein
MINTRLMSNPANWAFVLVASILAYSFAGLASYPLQQRINMVKEV